MERGEEAPSCRNWGPLRVLSRQATEHSMTMVIWKENR